MSNDFSMNVELPDNSQVYFVLGFINQPDRRPDIAGPFLQAEAEALANKLALENRTNYVVAKVCTNHVPKVEVVVTPAQS